MGVRVCTCRLQVIATWLPMNPSDPSEILSCFPLRASFSTDQSLPQQEGLSPENCLCEVEGEDTGPVLKTPVRLQWGQTEESAVQGQEASLKDQGVEEGLQDTVLAPEDG